jgi:hypothetical protein
LLDKGTIKDRELEAAFPILSGLIKYYMRRPEVSTLDTLGHMKRDMTRESRKYGESASVASIPDVEGNSFTLTSLHGVCVRSALLHSTTEYAVDGTTDKKTYIYRRA